MIGYEILLMLDPELPEDRQEEIVARVRESIEGSGGSWGAHDVWGRRRLAYEIDHKAEGIYHLLTFASDTETLDEATRVLKITDGVIRHMATRRIAAATGAVTSAPAEDAGADAEYAAREAEAES